MTIKALPCDCIMLKNIYFIFYTSFKLKSTSQQNIKNVTPQRFWGNAI